ncbi:MAG: bifunctional 4-hydroxy-2-oxoglutarate aldolase/2-dehydro-3-deoxy-phosphogluconate aldolase [Bacteroidales bacterium]|nr:bifunctional 4-hydroxy-2-oxoglutarate aldolase/2-dehydro-3-deoxy-phosphogluconate aldolase [Bacteroidales bacterium]
MKHQELYQTLKSLKVIPIIAIEQAEAALLLADALIEGGLPVAEITFRTEAAANVIKKLAKERPGLLVGAGTILTIDNLKKAQDCGARFGVAPGFNRKVVEETIKIGFPFSPGIMTPSDVEAALELGIKVQKFFPAEAAGGLTMLKSLVAPYAHMGVQFIPTGGLNINNAKDYLAIPQVIAVGGTWIAKKEDISAGSWKEIKERCQAVKNL